MPNVNDLKPDYKAAAEFLGGLPLESINVTALAPDQNKPIKSHSFKQDAAGIAGCQKFLEKYGSEGRNLYFNCNDLNVRLSKSKRVLPDGTTKTVFKAEEAEVRRFNMPFTDVDPPRGTAQADLPAARAKLLARAKAHQPAPTIIINSGNGFGLFWVLDKPIKVTPANLLTLKGYNKKLIDDLEGDPACVNLDHVMRIPYTINMPGANKRKAGRVPVMATLIDDDSSLNSCTIDQFTSAQVEAGASTTVTSGNEYAGIGSPEIPDNVDLSKLAPRTHALIVNGAAADADRSKAAYGVACDLRRAGWSDGAIIHVLTNPDYRISDHMLEQKQRPHEDQAARIIIAMNDKGIVPDAAPADPVDDFADSLSDEVKKKNALRKIVAALKITVENATAGEVESAETLVFNMAKRYGITPEEIAAARAADDIECGQASASSTSSTAGAPAADVHQPITPNATWETLLRDYVYVTQQGQFVRRSDGAMWDVDKFEKKVHSVRFWINPPGSDLKTPMSVTAKIFDLGPYGGGMDHFDSFCFMPGKDERYNNKYNQFRPSLFKPVQGDTTLWDAHLKYLLPDEDARDRLLNWCSWVLKHPTLHPNHALAMIGAIQGTGKTAVATVLSRLLSSADVTRLTERHLTAAHETWPLRTKIGVIEIRKPSEILSGRLFYLTTSPTISVDIKGTSDFDITNVLALWIESNKPGPILDMDDSDRRFLIINVDEGRSTPLPKLANEYYEKIYGKDGDGTGMVDDPAAMSAIMFQLLNRDLHGYSGLHPAPFTAAKKTMQESGWSPLRTWMAERDGIGAEFGARLMSVEIDILPKLPPHIKNSYNYDRDHRGGLEAAIADVLRGKPFYGENLGQVEGRGQRFRLWYTHRHPVFKSLKGVDGKLRVETGRGPPGGVWRGPPRVIPGREVIQRYQYEHRDRSKDPDDPHFDPEDKRTFDEIMKAFALKEAKRFKEAVDEFTEINPLD
jgi:hypothetical protein